MLSKWTHSPIKHRHSDFSATSELVELSTYLRMGDTHHTHHSYNHTHTLRKSVSLDYAPLNNKLLVLLDEMYIRRVRGAFYRVRRRAVVVNTDFSEESYKGVEHHEE